MSKIPAKQLFTGVPEDVGQANVEGTSDNVARADHVHAHGQQPAGDGLDHALASAGLAGFMSAADKSAHDAAVTKLAGIPANADNTAAALAAAAAAISVNNQRITNVGTPTAATDAANKAYVDAAVQGLDPKASVRAVATVNIALTGLQTVDGVALANGDRVLVVAQTLPATNGIWVVNSGGAWTRASDADASSKVTAGMYTYVAEGIGWPDTSWVLTTDDPIVLGTTALQFTQFSGAGQITAGAGVVKSGNTLDVVANADGSIVVNANDVQVGTLATDGQHGTRGGGTLHSSASQTAAGFMSAADKTKLDGVAASATATPLSSTVPSSVGSSNVIGTGTTAARADHAHAHGSQTDPTHHALATTSAHGFMASTDKTKLDGLQQGVQLSSATPAAIGATAAVGVGTSASKDDHVHAHGSQTDPAMHAVATGSAAGFLSAADKTKLDGVATGATATPLATSAPAAIDTIAVLGTSTRAAKEDHVHAHGAQTDPTLHAIATITAAGFMSALDKIALDGLGVTSPQFVDVAVLMVNVNPYPWPNASGNIDGYSSAAYADGRPILFVSQANPLDNGLWMATAPNGAFVRYPGWEAGTVLRKKLLFIVRLGMHAPNAYWMTNGLPATIGTDALTFVPLSSIDFRQQLLWEGAGTVDMANHRLINTTNPIGAQDAATKQYVDTAVSGGTQLSSTTPASVGVSGAVGTGTTAARADHVHAHGIQTDGTLHAAASTTVAGFLSAADKTKLDGVAASATNTPLATVAPVAVATTAVLGTSTKAAKEDHAHAHGVQTDGTLHAAATTSVAGFLSAADKTRLDGMATGATATPLSSTAPAAVGAAASVGVSTTAARADHVHQGVQLTSAAPAAVGVTAAAGVGTAAARDDHVHAHGAQTDGTLHAAASTTVAGFLSAADKTKLDSIASGATSVALSSAAPAAVGVTAAVGVGTAASRDDHVHAHGAQTDGTLHAIATQSVAGFLSAADKTKLDTRNIGAKFVLGYVWTKNVDLATLGSITTNTANYPTGITQSQGAVTGSNALVLLAGQTVAAENGVYRYSGRLQDIAFAGTFTREPGADTAADYLTGFQVFVNNGTDAGLWITTPATVTLGTTAITFRRSGAHGDRTDQLMHAVATGAAHGFMSSTDKTKLDGVATGADVTATALAAAATALSVNNQRITNLGTPTASSDAANKSYVDATVQGLDVKTSCRLLSNSTPSFTGPATIDSVAVVTGDRILVATAAGAVTDGIWIANTSGAWTRATDADIAAKVTAGMFTFISEGATYADTGWVLVTNDPITLGTTTLVFTQFTGVGQVNSGAGLTKTGNTLDVGANVDGSIFVNANDIQVGILATDTQHGNRGGAALHALAVANGANGFLSGTDKAKLDGVAANATNTPLTSAAPADIALTAAVGVATTAARADHAHAHGSQTDATHHAVATGALNGFMSATDKTQLDWILQQSCGQIRGTSGTARWVRAHGNLAANSTSTALVSNTVYCVYAGYANRAFTISNLRFYQPTASVGTDNGNQFGWGTGDRAPDGGLATINPVAVSVVQSPAVVGVKLWGGAAATCPANSYLWLFIKSLMSTTQMSCYSTFGDVTGNTQTKATAGTLVVGTPFTTTTTPTGGPDLHFQAA